MKTVALALNCPNCGAAVASDKTQCEFCKCRLKTVGCPSCLGLMFLGSKFCTRCGAKAVTSEIIDSKNVGECPRCRIELQLLQIDATSIRECERCGGFWADVDTFETICIEEEQQAAVLNFIGSDAHPNAHPPSISYVPCPDCKQLMNRSNFARSSGVIIDTCKQHGVWFDADELPKILEFINGGGLSRAREKERLDIEEQRKRLRDEQRRQAAQDQRYGLQPNWADENRSAVSKIVRLLFD